MNTIALNTIEKKYVTVVVDRRIILMDSGSLMKRGINGVYHHASRKYLHRYTDEYAYRYNSRKEMLLIGLLSFLLIALDG